MTQLAFVTLSALSGIATVAVSDAQTADAASIYRRTRDSVVAIEVTTKTGMAYGTGFFYGDGKTIATCNHVVDGATQILIRGTRGSVWKPESLSYDLAGDTVLLHLPASAKRSPLAGSHKAEVGEPVFVIGNPLGILTGSLSTGIISARRRIDTLPLVQTTAPISEGSSGSPVLDRHGRVLGMVSFTFSEGQNLNMAIGSEVLSWVAADHRVVSLADLYSANEGSGSAPMRMARKDDSTPAGDRPAIAKAREALVERIADYDSRVIDGFVRWQVAQLRWSRNEGGVVEADVRRAHDEFAAEVAGIDRIGASATAAEAPDYFLKVQSGARSMANVADDKFRQDREWVLAKQAGTADDGMAKRDVVEYGRAVQALCQLGAATEDATWMDVVSLYGHYSAVAKGECVLLSKNAFVDPDLSQSTTVRAAMDGSPFKEGDEVSGARLIGSPSWRPIDTWNALWDFTAQHGEMLNQRGWEVRVVRDGKEVAILMQPAGK